VFTTNILPGGIAEIEQKAKIADQQRQELADVQQAEYEVEEGSQA
jgi:hypothetical protein